MWPHDDTNSLIAFYGDPRGGNGHVAVGWANANLVRITPPWRMVESWDTSQVIHYFVMHRKVQQAMDAILLKVWQIYKTQEEIEKVGLHLWGGAFNYRPTRGGSRLSCHAFGAAIDLNPDGNPMGHTVGTMPSDVVQAFKEQGAFWGGDFQSRKDPMHFQFAHE